VWRRDATCDDLAFLFPKKTTTAMIESGLAARCLEYVKGRPSGTESHLCHLPETPSGDSWEHIRRDFDAEEYGKKQDRKDVKKVTAAAAGKKPPKWARRAVSEFGGSASEREVGTLKARALVIGINEYERDPLQNAVNDARDVAAKLEEIGFDVDLLTDKTQEGKVSRGDILGHIREFEEKVDENTVAVFAFMGHGVEYGGKQYFLPSEMVDEPKQLEDDGIDQRRTLDRIQNKKPLVTLAFLDCCREHVGDVRGGSCRRTGLAALEGPAGSLVLYATSEGQMALDSSPGGRNGMFTETLLEFLGQPGLELHDMAINVCSRVKVKTEKKQTPQHQSSLTATGLCLVDAAIVDDDSPPEEWRDHNGIWLNQRGTPVDDAAGGRKRRADDTDQEHPRPSKRRPARTDEYMTCLDRPYVQKDRRRSAGRSSTTGRSSSCSRRRVTDQASSTIVTPQRRTRAQSGSSSSALTRSRTSDFGSLRMP